MRSVSRLIPILLLVACGNAQSVDRARPSDAMDTPSRSESTARSSGEVALATFAGGCFWCMEKPFDELDGVISTTSGYSGGSLVDPTYEQVSAGGTGHAEVVQVAYDPSRVTYEELLHVFWRNVDPLTANRQFCDSGSQYRSAIFVRNQEERSAAERSLADLAGRFSSPIVTEIVDFEAFYPAEDYHQDYYQKNPIRYRFYRSRCGRDQRLQQVWGDEAGAHAE